MLAAQREAACCPGWGAGWRGRSLFLKGTPPPDLLKYHLQPVGLSGNRTRFGLQDVNSAMKLLRLADQCIFFRESASGVILAFVDQSLVCLFCQLPLSILCSSGIPTESAHLLQQRSFAHAHIDKCLLNILNDQPQHPDGLVGPRQYLVDTLDLDVTGARKEPHFQKRLGGIAGLNRFSTACQASGFVFHTGLAQPYAAALTCALRIVANQFDAGTFECLDHFHQRVDIPAHLTA